MFIQLHSISLTCLSRHFTILILKWYKASYPVLKLLSGIFLLCGRRVLNYSMKVGNIQMHVFLKAIRNYPNSAVLNPLKYAVCDIKRTKTPSYKKTTFYFKAVVYEFSTWKHQFTYIRTTAIQKFCTKYELTDLYNLTFKIHLHIHVNNSITHT